MINKCLNDYIQEFPEMTESEIEARFIKDTIEKIGNIKVSLEEAEEIWSDHSLSLFATWLGISENETMEGLFQEIIDKDVINPKSKEFIFEILSDETRKIK